MPMRAFWIAASAAVPATAGLAVVVAKLWETPGGVEGAVSGAILGSLLTLTGFALLLKKQAYSMGIFALFFFLKVVFLVAGALLLSQQPQLGRHDFYMGGFLGGALLGSMVGGFFLLPPASAKGTPRV